MKKRVYPIVCLMLIGMFLTGGCIGPSRQKAPDTVYYTLEYDSPVFKSPAPVDRVLQIEAFQCAPEYDSTQIIYREDGFRRDGYYYHRWRARPGDLIPYFLARDFTQAGAFKAVFAGSGNQSATHRLEGRIEEFYEQDATDGWNAVVSTAIALLAEDEPDVSKRVLFQKSYRISEPCAEKNPKAVVQAFSRATSRLSKAVLADVYNALADSSSAPSGK